MSEWEHIELEYTQKNVNAVIMEEAYDSDSEVSVGSDTQWLSLQYTASSFEKTSSRESDEATDHESGRVEPYQYEPEDS